ncbi:MAG: 2-amino-4-hydroxy-6-hydroxymethyldihydropteridine diphosphokinase [Gammaproteobacteria bacterium]|nr:2-amino-4-hydroxy-6-hydroxymethyldihydropteridine diphosphokinase [Gammaproteobacteria bacterium]MDH5618853.1 2-amino-4-hydroxy-6-hydroxymethyldihydropteridine diphosphokinase [Gammaproteobacteria bacterium]
MTPDQHWYPAYVGIGSNLQGPSRQVEAAAALLAEVPGTRLVAVSSLYRSAAFGGVEQPDFVNAVAAILTTLSPAALLQGLQAIETRQGRERGAARWGPRVIDLDLLVYSREKIDSPELTVPHPGIGERNFVLLPLGEIAPDLVIPGLGRVADIPVNMNEPGISRIA